MDLLRNSLNLALKPLLHVRAAQNWSKVSVKNAPTRLRWWESPIIIEHVNEKICGERIQALGAATAELIKQRYPGRTFATAVSIGCGNGAKEIALVESGLVEEFHLFELSKVRVEAGRKLAEQAGVKGQVIFHNEDGLKHQQPNRFDLVHWSNSLHHMLNVDQAIGWSHVTLKPNGLFFMDDFVGPDRMQWSDKMLQMASRVRTALPKKYLKDPKLPHKSLPSLMTRPSRLRMWLADPTECADSSNIIPCLKKWFPDIEITATGGAIYHLALNDVLHNFNEMNDRALLEKLLKIDDLCTRRGEFHYAVAVAEKR